MGGIARGTPFPPVVISHVPHWSTQKGPSPMAIERPYVIAAVRGYEDMHERWLAEAKARGKSLNQFVIGCVEEVIANVAPATTEPPDSA